MDKHESFNDFQIKLMDIVNQSHQLGDPYSESRVVQKILRSLPDRFESKVTTIKENRDLDTIKVNQLIGKIQAYEFRKLLPSSRKQKGIALKTTKHEKEESDLDEEMAVRFLVCLGMFSMSK